MKPLKQHELDQVAGGGALVELAKDVEVLGKVFFGEGFSDAAKAFHDKWKEARDTIRNN